MLLLGIDIGTSSIKASVVDVHSQECIASAQYPEKETDIISIQTGWAEQSPAHAFGTLFQWRQYLLVCIFVAHAISIWPTVHAPTTFQVIAPPILFE